MRAPKSPKSDALIVNGAPAQYREEGDYLVFGDISQRVNLPVASSSKAGGSNATAEKPVRLQALEIVQPKEPIRLGLRGSRAVTLKVRNRSTSAEPSQIRLRLPRGVAVEASDGATIRRDDSTDGAAFIWELPMLSPQQATPVQFRLRTDGTRNGGLHPGTMEVAPKNGDGWTLPVALPIAVGPTLVEDNSFPTFGEYVIYAPRYTLRMSKRYGTSRFLRDDEDRPRYEATFWNRRPASATTSEALPQVRINDEVALAWGDPAQFIWPNSAPASVTVGTQRSRLAWSFEDDAVRIEPVALWSADAPHEFVFPGENIGWTAWGAPPRWSQIIAVGKQGKEEKMSEPPAHVVKIFAAELTIAGFEESICFATDRPQAARFEGASIRITVKPGEPIWFGLATPQKFEQWRRLRPNK